MLLADDFLTDLYPGVTSDLVKSFNDSGRCQLSVMEVNGDDISKYGVIVPSDDSNIISGLIEKPSKELAPSNLASIGRYVLTPKIFEILRKQPKGAGEEIQLADAINTLAQKEAVEMVKLRGIRFDCGSVAGFMKAFEHEYKKRFTS